MAESIDVKIRVDDSELKRGLKGIETATAKTAATATTNLGKINKAYQQQAESIAKAFDEVKEAAPDLSGVVKEYDNAFDASRRYLQELSQGTQNISNAKEATESLNRAMQTNVKTLADNESILEALIQQRTKLGELDNEMAKNGVSEADRKAVKQQYDDIQNEIQARTLLKEQLEANQTSLQTYSDTIQSISKNADGTFSTAAEAAAKFGSESGKLQETLTAMKSTIGESDEINQLADVLDKATVAGKGTAQATTQGAEAAKKGAKGFAAFGKALSGIAMGGVIAVVGIVINLITEVINRITRLSSAMKEIEKAANTSIAHTKVTFESLADSFARVNSEAEKAKWIKDHQKDFDELGISIRNAAEAERIFNAENQRQLELLKGTRAAMAETDRKSVV